MTTIYPGPSPCRSPVRRVETTVGVAATSTSDAFAVEGDGVVRIAVTCSDANTPVGTFSFEFADREAESYDAHATTIAKAGGTALAGKAAALTAPGGQWMRIKYTRTSGGGAGQLASVVVTVW